MGLFYGKNEFKWPAVVKAVAETTCYYICQTLYPDEFKADVEKTLKERLILSDINAGVDVSVGDAVSIFKETNSKYPFTAYNVEDSDIREDELCHLAKMGQMYDSNLKKFISVWPKFLSISFVTFFTNPRDYHTAKTILDNQNVSLTRLQAPIKICDVETTIPIDVGFEISKGSYAGEFEEHLRINHIYDIVHNTEIKYYEMLLDGEGINEVDNIILSIQKYDDEQQSVLQDTAIVPSPPEITEVSPVNGSVDIPVTATFTITFDKAMNEDSIFNAWQTTPYISGNFDWDSTSKVLGFTPISNLEKNTLYTVSISKEMMDGNLLNMVDDYSFSFTTTVI